MPSSPYISPFPRSTYSALYAGTPRRHVEHRAALESFFKTRNLDGWHHDLGAQDVFLDNLGIVLREQMMRMPWESRYLSFIQLMLNRWCLAESIPLGGPPWWGKHLNSEDREGVGGEPRGLLRLLPEDLARLSEAECELLDLGEVHWLELEPEGESFATLLADGVLLDVLELLPKDDRRSKSWRRLMRWSSEGWPLLFEDGGEDLRWSEVGAEPRTFATGALLPTEMMEPVGELRLLHPRHCTPDLPIRVGVDEDDLRMYREVLKGRDQGSLPTCASFAVAIGLEVAGRRAGGPLFSARFSPAHLHRSTGPSVDDGRWLSEVVDAVIEDGVPCREGTYPYEWLADGTFDPEGDDEFNRRLSADQQALIGFTPIVRRLEVHDISTLKALLAAGWVIVISTRITKDFWDLARCPAIRDFGLLLTPLPGEQCDSGHAWCLVGYDHVDGALNWKYQGRFIALNWWGPGFGGRSPHGAGTVSIPFAFLLTEGFEAFALRIK